MREVSFYSPARDRFVCRETGDRFAVVHSGPDEFTVYINECKQVRRRTRKEALDYVEQEARIALR